jgi:mRNA interferase MazF
MPRGSIVLVPFPFTNLSEYKIRPALILFSQNSGDDRIVAFITSNKQNKLGNFDIPIKPSKMNGIKVESIVKVNKIATLHRKTILGELGDIEPDTLKRVENSLRELFCL